MYKAFKIFENDKELERKDRINIFLLVMILSGIFGFIYEIFFYRIDLGYFVKRGSTFGPWIPIYLFGGGLITIFTYRLRKKPILVFLANCMITGILEYVTGFVLYEVWGTRLWDYNTEIWNWGNINGYICARSILFFGISSLMLIYGIIPLVIRFVKKFSQKNVTILAYILSFTFIIDMILYAIIK